MNPHKGLGLAIALSMGLALHSAAAIASILDLSDIDAFGFRIDGPDGGRFGAAVSSAGDFNGDGINDLIVGAPDFYDGVPVGAAYIFLGPVTASSKPAVTMIGRNKGQLGTSVALAGDVNGDGFDDVLIGAPSTRYDNKLGRAYLLYGGASHPSTIRANNLGNLGVELIGAESKDRFGHSVSAAGDINNDGMADFVVGGPESKVGGQATGAAVIIYGGPSLPPEIELSIPFDHGVVLLGEAEDDQFGADVAALGDFNGDGVDDIIIGAPYSLSNDIWSGAAYVVHGRTELGNVIHAGNLGDGGFRIAGVRDLDFLGEDLAGGYDVNGDGLGDALIGAIGDPSYGSFSGSALILLGSSSTEDFDRQQDGPRSYAILTDEASGHLGAEVALLPDQNGDGRPEILLGAPHLSKNGVSSGSAFLIASDFANARRVMNAYSPGVFRFDGAKQFDFASQVAYLGPITNDSTEYVAIGAHSANFGGSVYIVDIPISANGLEINGRIDGVWFPQIDGVPLQDVGFVLDAVPKENNTTGQNLMVGAWFTHDEPVRFPGASNRWITMQGTYATGSSRADVELFQVTGGDFFGAFPGITVQVGSGHLKFNNCTTARFEFSLFDGDIEDVWQLKRSFPGDAENC